MRRETGLYKRLVKIRVQSCVNGRFFLRQRCLCVVRKGWRQKRMYLSRAGAEEDEQPDDDEEEEKENDGKEDEMSE